MEKNSHRISRRGFLNRTGAGVLGGGAVSALGFATRRTVPDSGAKRVALVGTGIRGMGMWGRDLVSQLGDHVEVVGLCDINRVRLELAGELVSSSAGRYTDFRRMIEETRPEVVIVCTRDSVHHEQIIAALEMGCDVVTEKPMTTDEAKCQAILDAEKKSGKTVTVGFNYRYSPTAEKLKELVMTDAIGQITSIDFHWYLDVYHGADYFRRWHAYEEFSGTLYVHKSTHHFDLVNWLLEADPVEVSAFGDLRKYGKKGPFRGSNCRSCPHKDDCEFFWDITRNRHLVRLYVDAEGEDGYLRDACVFREDIDIYDTMTAVVRYSNGCQMSYSLNAFMPYEGYHLALNGENGRIELRVFERQPWEVPRQDEIRVTRNFGESEVLVIPHARGGHFGADPKLKEMLFKPGTPDPYRQRAGSRAGAMSVLTGVAAVKSAKAGTVVRIGDLIRL